MKDSEFITIDITGLKFKTNEDLEEYIDEYCQQHNIPQEYSVYEQFDTFVKLYRDEL